MVNYTEKKVIVKESEIHGYGLFADQMIGSNHSIIEYVGDVVSEDEYEERKEQYEDEGIAEKYIMKLGDDQYIDATINGNDSRYINHSCEPNSYALLFKESGINHVWIVSLSEIIYQGDEITIGYGFDDGTPCNCGTPTCRGFL